MANYVNDTAAAKQISAYVVMKGSRHVATVRAHHGNSRVLVECFQSGEAEKRSAAALKIKDAHRQQGSANGYGYDKFAAALSGMVVDGHAMTDHCGARKKLPKAGGWPRDAKAPKGWHFANVDRVTGLYTSCYRHPGLRYLEETGYQVIQAI